MLYFTNCTNLDEGKGIYKGLYMAFNKDSETMAEINSQFTAFKALIELIQADKPEPVTTGQEVQDIAQLAAKIEGCTVELCGNWIWVKCDRENNAAHEILKANRFRFSGNKKAWYYTNQPFKKRRGTSTLPKIKMKYGAEAIQAEFTT